MSRVDDIKKLIINHRRRLQILEEQKALHGLDTPPKILIEIEDIQAEIAKLQAGLEEWEDVQTSTPSTTSPELDDVRIKSPKTKFQILLVLAIIILLAVIASTAPLLLQNVNPRPSAIEYYNQGNRYASEQKYEQALEAYQEALKIDPDLIDAHINLAATYLLLGRADEAIVVSERALQIDATHPGALLNLGLAHKQMGHWSEAVDQFLRVLESDPQNPKALYNLAQVSDWSNHSQDAINYYQQFVEVAPDEYKGEILEAKKRIEELTTKKSD